MDLKRLKMLNKLQMTSVMKFTDQLKDENYRLRQALKFYADKKNYERDAFWKIVVDGGKIARRELGEDE